MVNVLDPACGSGNFLYVAINLLLDLEKQVISYGARHDFSWFPSVRPDQLAGVEINPYAQQLAQVVIWIGYLQWMHHNGFRAPSDPVLEPIENIRLMDAILDLSDPEQPAEPDWPEAEFIVGNPPFLGGKKMRSELGDEYMDALFAVWRERVRPEADLCCYWFEKARRQIEDGKRIRAGLLATQGIRGGANRETLKRLQDSGDIFFAESDRDWVLDGANVHVSMVGFDDGTETRRILDGKPVKHINPNLTATADVTEASTLAANAHLCFMGDTKGGPFEISEALAVEMLRTPNPHHSPSSDVSCPG
jgi:type II restriction/modification system DNA methylase subunit YeeA